MKVDHRMKKHRSSMDIDPRSLADHKTVLFDNGHHLTARAGMVARIVNSWKWKDRGGIVWIDEFEHNTTGDQAIAKRTSSWATSTLMNIDKG